MRAISACANDAIELIIYKLQLPGVISTTYEAAHPSFAWHEGVLITVHRQAYETLPFNRLVNFPQPFKELETMIGHRSRPLPDDPGHPPTLKIRVD